ncbi:Heparinase II/III-like protein [Opitutaceae bacterium TAV1]|nr:Heparinase II/III-like protein [Opitutaceae bacterium TAV1]
MKSFFGCLILCSSAFVASAAPTAQPGRVGFVADAARVTQLAEWIAATPRAGFTPAFADRDYWRERMSANDMHNIVRNAKKLAAEPIPVLTPELYDDFKKTGQRKPFERPYQARMERLRTFTLAEGLADSGMAANGFLPLIEAELAAIFDEPSWVMPAHAGQNKEGAYVDLGASMRAWSLATADWLLGERLSGDTRKRIRDEVRERVLAPYLERVRAGDSQGWWWMTTTNNWNAVCHSGVLGAALLLVEDAGERAEFAAAFEAGTRRFIAGFGDDGFCHEGLGYWNYGFGHYVLGAEALRRATGGKANLLAQDKVRRIAEFGARWQIAGNVYPAFSDVTLSAKPSAWLTDFIAIRFGLGAVAGSADLSGGSLYQRSFDLSLPRTGAGPSSGAHEGGEGLPLRDWFPDGGALIVRRRPAEQGLAAAFKGGNNNQPHNHNDLGSFVVMCDGRRVLTDLGGDTYVKDTFGPKRYTSGVLNSFGHPVPRVGGKLQRTGAAAKAVAVRTDFTDTADTWEIDLTSAYDVPGLERLTRTFVFSRTEGKNGRGWLEITDRVRFRAGTAPQAFGTALILRRGQERSGIDEQNHRFVVREGKAAVRVFYEAENGTVVIREERIHGIVPDRPPVGTRVGIDFTAPVHEAAIRVLIESD